MRTWNKKRKPKHHSKVKFHNGITEKFLFKSKNESTKFYCRVMRNKLKKSKIFLFGKRIGGKRKRCKAITLVKRKPS